MSEHAANFENVNILLGVSGGISAYKAVEVGSSVRKAGGKVKTVMTENACRLVGPKSFEAVTGSPVYSSLWSSSEEYQISHVSLSEWADIVVVAPATADIIGKAANGICDEILSTVLCTCWARPRLFAPAMNNNMWTNAAVQKNIGTLKEMGVQFIGPEEGVLACGTEGLGRMSEPADILKRIEEIARQIQRNK